MQTTHLWHPWQCRTWPLSAQEEERFYESLTSNHLTLPLQRQGSTIEPGEHPYVRSHSDYDRDDLSVLMIALRGGLTLDQLTDKLPGISIAGLRDAYNYLDAARSHAVNAWLSILTDPRLDTLTELSSSATPLFSLAVYRLTMAANHSDPRVLERAVSDARRSTERTRSDENAIEERIMSFQGSSSDASALGRLLYDPHASGVWSNPYYIPLRVGTLSPVRVRGLLAE